MHPYHSDDEIRKRVFVIGAFLAVGLARLFSIAIQFLPFAIPWWVEIPSVLGFYGMFVWLFDNYLWRLKVVQKWDLFYIPDLNGTWEMEVRSSFNDFGEPICGHAVIRQTASRIAISMETDTSLSSSVHAALTRKDKVHRFELNYNYVNQPMGDATGTMNIHHGSVCLQISDHGKALDGEYFSGRGRQTYGRIILRRDHRAAK